jgi:hypothetical protein
MIHPDKAEDRPMPNKHLPMKLSREEEIFLRHWMYDETHYRERAGLAKRLQVDQGAIPADLATIIAAAMPSLAEQELAGNGPPASEPPTWPWSGGSLAQRLAEAEALLFGKAGQRKDHVA